MPRSNDTTRITGSLGGGAIHKNMGTVATLGTVGTVSASDFSFSSLGGGAISKYMGTVSASDFSFSSLGGGAISKYMGTGGTVSASDFSFMPNPVEPKVKEMPMVGVAAADEVE